MCHFVSCVESGGSLYFMAKSILESPGFEAALESGEYQLDDVSGHGIIHSWFKLKSGRDLEYINLTTPKHIPETIVNAIKMGELEGVGYSLNLLNESGLSLLLSQALGSLRYIEHLVDTSRRLMNDESLEGNQLVSKIITRLVMERRDFHRSFWEIFRVESRRNPAWI